MTSLPNQINESKEADKPRLIFEPIVVAKVVDSLRICANISVDSKVRDRGYANELINSLWSCLFAFVCLLLSTLKEGRDAD